MASETLSFLLKVNVAAAAAILIVLALRAPMRRWFGARLAYALWLIVPVAAFAVMPPARIEFVDAPASAATSTATAAQTLGQLIDSPALMGVPADPTLLWLAAWFAGIVLAFALFARRQRVFMASLGRLSHETGSDTHRAEAAGFGPALVGAIDPRLVIPSDFEARFTEAERDVILAHERVHLRNTDPAINALVVLMQCINWFNPFVHVAAHAMRIDQELACDAAVMACHPGSRRSYAEAMLKTQVAPLSLPLGCYWPAHPAAALKQRIAMLKRDLPGRGRASAGAVLAVALGFAAAGAAFAAQPPLVISVVRSEAPIDTATAAPAPASDPSGANLIAAINRRDEQGAMKLIEDGADVNYARPGSGTPLMAAARGNMMSLTRQLLARGADPDIASRGNGNAMISAARFGHHEIVAELIKHGANVDGYVSEDETPLINAARGGHLRTVQVLVENGADVNLEVIAQPWLPMWKATRSPLGEAVKYRRRQVVDYLKSKGARM